MMLEMRLKPISQMLGLGYRRLNGQSELALMDEEILSQLENRKVNKEISWKQMNRLD